MYKFETRDKVAQMVAAIKELEKEINKVEAQAAKEAMEYLKQNRGMKVSSKQLSRMSGIPSKNWVSKNTIYWVMRQGGAYRTSNIPYTTYTIDCDEKGVPLAEAAPRPRTKKYCGWYVPEEKANFY